MYLVTATVCGETSILAGIHMTRSAAYVVAAEYRSYGYDCRIIHLTII